MGRVHAALSVHRRRSGDRLLPITRPVYVSCMPRLSSVVQPHSGDRAAMAGHFNKNNTHVNSHRRRYGVGSEATEGTRD